MPNNRGKSLNNSRINTPRGTSKVIYSQNEVIIYFILKNGRRKSNRNTYEILTVFEDADKSTYIKVGAWECLLIDGVFPCYRNSNGDFIFYDVQNDGTKACIVLPPSAKTTFSELLESIVYGGCQSITAVDISPRSNDDADGVSGLIANGLITGASYVSKFLIFGAQKTGELIKNSTPVIINNMSPEEEVQAPSSNLTNAVKIAKTTTNVAANVSGVIASNVATAASKLGQFLAPHVKYQGTRLLQSGFDMSDSDASNAVDGFLTVASGAFQGVATIYNGLESSASILGENIKTSSVKIVEHKYGGEYGQLTNDTLSTAGNIYQIKRNTKVLTSYKGLAKNAGKAIGQEVKKN